MKPRAINFHPQAAKRGCLHTGQTWAYMISKPASSDSLPWLSSRVELALDLGLSDQLPGRHGHGKLSPASCLLCSGLDKGEIPSLPFTLTTLGRRAVPDGVMSPGIMSQSPLAALGRLGHAPHLSSREGVGPGLGGYWWACSEGVRIRDLAPSLTCCSTVEYDPSTLSGKHSKAGFDGRGTNERALRVW